MTPFRTWGEVYPLRRSNPGFRVLGTGQDVR